MKPRLSACSAFHSHLTLALTCWIWGGGCRTPAPELPSPAKQPPACRDRCITPFGTVLGENAGVVGFSNCSDACIDPTPNHAKPPGGDEAKPVYTGIKWQCVEYARRWWLQRLGIVFASVDTADDMWRQVRSARGPQGRKTAKVTALENDGGQPPQVGDLIIYRANAAVPRLRFGHVAVVVEVDSVAGAVRLAEQNFDNRSWAEVTSYSRKLVLRRSEGYRVSDPTLSDGSAAIYGWLRPVGR